MKEEVKETDLKGTDLNERYGITSNSAYYRETGNWFARIRAFPTVLWDGPPFGYVRFETEQALRACTLLTIHPSGEITAPKNVGIKFIPGYVRAPDQEPFPEIKL
jgi:hypothetical protein